MNKNDESFFPPEPEPLSSAPGVPSTSGSGSQSDPLRYEPEDPGDDDSSVDYYDFLSGEDYAVDDEEFLLSFSDLLNPGIGGPVAGESPGGPVPMEHPEPASSSGASLEVPEPKKRRFNPEAKYSFSRPLARKVGADSAILLKYLAMLMGKSTRKSEGGRLHVRIASSELEKIYPWKKRRSWSDDLKSLCEEGYLTTTESFRKSGLDRSLSYSFEFPLSGTDEDTIFFRAGDAADHGVCAAVLLNNLRHFLRENLKEHGEQRNHAMKPQFLAGILPFSESTIKRALDSLEEKGVVQSKRNERILASEYWIPGYVPDLSEQSAQPNPPQPAAPEASPPTEENPRPPATAPSEDPTARDEGRVDFATLVANNRKGLSGDADAVILDLCMRTAKDLEPRLHGLEKTALLELQNADDDTRLRLNEKLLGLVREDRPLHCEIAVIAERRTVEGISSHAYTLRVGYEILQKLGRKAALWREDENEALLEQREKQIAEALKKSAPDAGQPELTPGQKQKIVRGMVSTRAPFKKNRLLDKSNLDLVAYPVRINSSDKIAITRFFEINPSWSAQNLFDLIERCAALSEAAPDGSDEYFNSRRGSRIRFLLTNLEAIIPELKMADVLPTLTVFDTADLYPKPLPSGEVGN